MDVATGPTTSIRFGLTDQAGVSALDVGRAVTGGGADYLRSAVDQILSGSTVHGGALLAPLGVRFVIAEHGDLPEQAEALLDAQVDLDRVGTSGLTIFRNAAAMPPAGILPATEQIARAVGSDDLGQIARLPNLRGVRLTAVSGGWAGVSPIVGVAVASTEFSPEWRAEIPDGDAVRPREAFGWSTSFDVAEGAVRIRFMGQWVRTLETLALGLLWAAALWVTRRPVAR
jgi:hypothetical protein